MNIVSPQAYLAKLRAAPREPTTDLSARFDPAPYLTPREILEDTKPEFTAAGSRRSAAAP
jgi:hypothetical protein